MLYSLFENNVWNHWFKDNFVAMTVVWSVKNSDLD